MILTDGNLSLITGDMTGMMIQHSTGHQEIDATTPILSIKKINLLLKVSCIYKMYIYPYCLCYSHLF